MTSPEQKAQPKQQPRRLWSQWKRMGIATSGKELGLFVRFYRPHKISPPTSKRGSPSCCIAQMPATSFDILSGFEPPLVYGNELALAISGRVFRPPHGR